MILFWSSVGKKGLTAVTGLAMALFVVIHLVGNFTFYMGPDAFNGYAHFLEHLAHGWFRYAAEIGLIVMLLVHLISTIAVTVQNRRLRRDRYHTTRDAGGASQKTFSSKTMIYTGSALLVFIVLHIIHFRLGPGVEAGYTTTVHGEEVRDLYTLVAEHFQSPVMTFGYVAFMLLLGFHLRHGLWSAMHSLGLTTQQLMPIWIFLALVSAIVLAVGFLVLPLYIYFFLELPVAETAVMMGP